ncbi:hypothetical protein MCEMSEM47_01892 [Burkholderiales bacterium]
MKLGFVILDSDVEPVYELNRLVILEQLNRLGVPFRLVYSDPVDPACVLPQSVRIVSSSEGHFGERLYRSSLDGFSELRSNYPDLTHFVRTNLSSVFSVARLNRILEGLSQRGLYAGPPCGIYVTDQGRDFIFRSGAGIIITADIVDHLMSSGLPGSMLPDDVLFGVSLQACKQIDTPMYSIIDLQTGESGSTRRFGEHLISLYSSNAFHIRVKNHSGPLRLKIDAPIYRYLWHTMNLG